MAVYFMGAVFEEGQGLVSEHRMYALEFHSHVGNCVYVHGSGRMRDKES